MRYCKRCLYNELHPLNLVIDSEGICSGCRIHEEKDKLDWGKRGQILGDILSNYRNSTGNNYDCIIPVSGARDSYFIVDTIKNVYGMNPLLVTYNKHYNTDVGIRNLANLRIKFDCDIMTLTVNPETVKKITRSTFRRFGSIYWHCLAGQTVYPVQMAVKLKIPLIIWGVHQGIDQVGMFSHTDEVEMTRKYRKEHDLMGYEAEDLVDLNFDNLTTDDLRPYFYPDDKEIEHVGVRGIYLNNYVRWDSRAQHEDMIKKFQFESLSQTRTFDSYNDVDCWNYSDIHDYIKLVKWGYGKVLDHSCREIRLRRMTREEGIKQVSKYIFNKPAYLDLFLEWIGITENAFHFILDQHRNKIFWRRNTQWEWEFLQDILSFGTKSDDLDQAGVFSEFKITPVGVSTDNSNNYILIGKGYS
ncbi:N-acetyl sugar amidotransferase [Daejeonella sp.]|uniref:N-acetyl sugar amidotransferase n=1 Tax=Daejeonella sp. TaxID=2805397 RepID=UPI0025C7197E|nr:N-acetyl sugar amidotransferase [Daejeonella sp.]